MTTLFHHPPMYREQRKFDARGRAGLVEQAADVMLDGVFTDAEADGDFAVAAAVDDAAQDVLFARRQAIKAGNLADTID